MTSGTRDVHRSVVYLALVNARLVYGAALALAKCVARLTSQSWNTQRQKMSIDWEFLQRVATYNSGEGAAATRTAAKTVMMKEGRRIVMAIIGTVKHSSRVVCVKTMLRLYISQK